MDVPEGFEPHPEGGWFRETWRSPVRLNTPRGPRDSATAISYFLGPGEQSRWHRVRGSEELWIWTGGGTLELTVGGTGMQPADAKTVELGPGAQHLVGAGEWQSARPAEDGVLVTCVVSPGFDYADFEVWEEITAEIVLDPTVSSWQSTLPPLRLPPPDRDLSLLLVCQANMCRSAMAEKLLVRALQERGTDRVRVGSAGLRTVAGSGMDRQSVRLLDRYGVADPDFRTTQFEPDLADADLVLTATTAQRDEVVRRAPHARDRTFAWRELLALAGAEPLAPLTGEVAVDRLTEAVRQVRERRGLVQPDAEGGFDVPDPIGRPPKTFDRIGEEIAASMDQLAVLLSSILIRPGIEA